MGLFSNPVYTSFLICIVIVVLIGCLVAYRLKQGADEDDGSTTDDELRKGFELAYYAGEIDAAEFKRVTEALDAKKHGGGRAATPPPAPTVIPPITEPEPPAEQPPPTSDEPA